jgi:methylglutaconyl-CoA hydratase
MKRASQFTHAQNVEVARRFAGMLRTLSGLEQATIARVQGAALGGGTGLAAACDMAVASDDATFSTSEVKFGIIPSVFSPYVLRAIGAAPMPCATSRAPSGSAPRRALAIGLVRRRGGRARNSTAALPASSRPCSLAARNPAGRQGLDCRRAWPAIDDAVSEGNRAAYRPHSARPTKRRRASAAFLDKRLPSWLA